jgi:hypothetical protein
MQHPLALQLRNLLHVHGWQGANEAGAEEGGWGIKDDVLSWMRGYHQREASSV